MTKKQQKKFARIKHQARRKWGSPICPMPGEGPDALDLCMKVLDSNLALTSFYYLHPTMGEKERPKLKLLRRRMEKAEHRLLVKLLQRELNMVERENVKKIAVLFSMASKGLAEDLS